MDNKTEFQRGQLVKDIFSKVKGYYIRHSTYHSKYILIEIREGNTSGWCRENDSHKEIPEDYQSILSDRYYYIPITSTVPVQIDNYNIFN